MKKQAIIDLDVIEVIEYLNALTGRRYRPIKTNAVQIQARLKEGFTKQELKEIIQVKTLEWKNNPVMAQHLSPITLFRNCHIDKYLNQVQDVKNDPERYKKHFAKINKKSERPTIADAFAKIDSMPIK